MRFGVNTESSNRSPDATVSALRLWVSQPVRNLSVTGTSTARTATATDNVGNGPGDLATFTTVRDTTAPTVTNVTSTLADGAYKAGQVIPVTVTFSEPVSGVDISDFTLTRDSNVVSLSGLTVTTITSSTYSINLASVTSNFGQYVLTLNGIDVESVLEETHTFGDSWEESLAVGIGKVGNPYAPDMEPLVSVSVANLTFTSVALQIFGVAPFNLPTMTSTLSGESLS